VKKRIKEKLFERLKEKELYFIMGTHFTYGTWLITGIFCLKKKALIRGVSLISGRREEFLK
jgi:hypothetical protein